MGINNYALRLYPATFVHTGASLLGFKKNRSLVGKLIQKNSTHNNLRKIVPVILIILFAFCAVIPNLSLAANIGGVPSINAVPEPIKIEAATRISVQVPVATLYISQGFSWHHNGVDLVSTLNTPVYPIMDGQVIAAQSDWIGYGKHVIIDHGAGFTSLYAHFSEIDVNVGDKVNTKTQIGKVGMTGFTTGPHVHLEVYQDGKLIDPAEILPETSVVASK